MTKEQYDYVVVGGGGDGRVTEIEVRPRRDHDLQALGQVLVRVHQEDGYPVEGVADPIGWLTLPRLLVAWAAVYRGHPVGHAALTLATLEDDAARIWHEHTGERIDRLAIPIRLFVDPVYRSHGVGGMLTRTVQEYGRKQGLALAFDVMLKDRAAIRLYEAAGCVKIGNLTHRHGDGKSEPAAVYVVPTA